MTYHQGGYQGRAGPPPPPPWGSGANVNPPTPPPPTPRIGVNELGQPVPTWPDLSKPDTRGIPLHESLRNLWRKLRRQ